MTTTLRFVFSIAALTVSSFACATASSSSAPRADRGHISVTAEPPAINTQVITKFNFHIEDGRISEVQPGNSAGFSYSLGSNGCLRGQELQEYCPAPSLPGDRPGSKRWRAADGTRTFTVALSDDHNTLTTEFQRMRGIYALGSGAAVDQLRDEPWMLGIAFARHAEPNTSGIADGPVRDYHFKVESSN